MHEKIKYFVVPINLSFEKCIFLDSLKAAVLVPMHKNGQILTVRTFSNIFTVDLPKDI